MCEYMRENHGNPSSLYKEGREAKQAIDAQREKIANVIGANPEEIIFTSGGSESDNLAIKGTALANRKEGKHIITSKVEHPAVLNTCQYLEKHGFEVTYAPVDEYGMVRVSAIEDAIRDDTVLITVMHANNEVGTVMPIKEIGEIARDNNVTFHTDAVQSTGKLPIDVDEMGVDMLSMSGHKIYAPKGIGALYLRKGVKLDPLIHGGAQENKRRAGTENTPGIIALGKALEIAQEEMTRATERESKLRDHLIEGILEGTEDSYLNGHPTKRLPGNAHLRFDHIEGESILLHLNMRGVAVSTGSACASGSLDPSHVLLAMGLKPEQAHGSLRLTLGRENTREQIDYTIESTIEVVEKLREMSPR